MNEVKSIFASKSFWGSALVILSVAARSAGYDIGDTDGLANIVVELIGSGLAIYGRVKAVKKIGSK